jgi:hypothetical protein
MDSKKIYVHEETSDMLSISSASNEAMHSDHKPKPIWIFSNLISATFYRESIQ